MAANAEPYPPNSFYAVHVGFSPGVYNTYRLLQAQTEGFGSQVQFEVFEDRQHAEQYVQTGAVPPGVIPLAANVPNKRPAPAPTPSTFTSTSAQPKPAAKPLFRPARGTSVAAPAVSGASSSSKPSNIFPALSSNHPLPTPSASPQAITSVPSSSQSTRTRAPAVSPTRPTAGLSNVMPTTPKKGKPPTGSETDEEGDTEPEEDVDGILGPPAISSRKTPTQAAPQTPVAGSTSFSKPTALGRKPTPGSITAALRRSQGLGAMPTPLTATSSISTAPVPTPVPALPTATMIFPTLASVSKLVNTSSTPKVNPKPIRATPTSIPAPSATSTSSASYITPATPTATPAPGPRPVQVQAEAGPSKPRAGSEYRMCTHCEGMGRVLHIVSDADTSREEREDSGTEYGLRKRVGSIGLDGRPRKRSDVRKRGEGRVKARLDKGKGKARVTDTEDESVVPTISRPDYAWNTFL